MAGIAHIGVGLAAIRLAPNVPLWVLVISSEALDLLWGLFALVRIESFGESPWSHGLLMSVGWSAVAGMIGSQVYRSSRTGVVIGLLVFSHWVIDFVTHPMFGGPPDLPLLFSGSQKVGLGVYSRIPPAFTVVIEIACVIAGLVLYLKTRKQNEPAARHTRRLRIPFHPKKNNSYV